MEREILPVDVLFVGAGPANLAAAYRLGKRLKDEGREAEILVIEKAQTVGDHILSGAVMDPRGMIELFGDDWADSCPVDATVTDESVFFLTEASAFRFPFIPPTLKNHSNVIVSMSKVVAWMKEKAEEQGVMICEGMPGAEVLYDGERVIGVRTADRGLGKDGSEGAGFEPGTDIHANVTVFGEGSRGSLTETLINRFSLQGENPQVYGTGIKEVWDVPAGRIKAGEIWHTAGWPLNNNHYGGSWIYGVSDTRVSIGLVSALDSGDASFDPYFAMQSWKTHPKIASLLESGTLVKSGAKTIPEGGHWARPRPCGDGFLIVGDSGGFLNIARLKGIHLALKSGMLAADVIGDAIAGDDTSSAALSFFDRLVAGSWIHDELWKARNYRAAFQSGFWMGGILSNIMQFTGGRLLRNRIPMESDAESMQKDRWQAAPLSVDGKLTFDKVTGVYNAGAIHEENQPSHLLIADLDLCRGKCAEEYGNPCQNFCPAEVYEMVSNGDDSSNLHLNPSNCVHCKTCDILDPYGAITWTVPSDAGGPKYMGL